MANQDSLGKKLSFLSSGSIDVPFDDNAEVSPALTFEQNQKEKSDNSDFSVKPKKKKDKIQEILDESNEFLEENYGDLIFDFDSYMNGKFSEDEDADLRNNLIGLGRKYARDNKGTAESSEVAKAFSKSEKALDDLYSEIQKDKIDLQKDIASMRNMRTRNFKSLADLVTTKSALHSTALSTIKEMNAIKKAQFDINFKSKKDDKDNADSTDNTNRAIQSLFGIGRDNILGSVGGYESVSGAISESLDSVKASGSYTENDDEFIQKKYFSDTDESDGDKFLKYEGMGVEYILLIDDDSNYQVIAESADGDIIPDYPMPTNVDELNFNISESTGTAEDDLHRKYKVRHI